MIAGSLKSAFYNGKNVIDEFFEIKFRLQPAKRTKHCSKQCCKGCAAWLIWPAELCKIGQQWDYTVWIVSRQGNLSGTSFDGGGDCPPIFPELEVYAPTIERREAVAGADKTANDFKV